jgi:hypothetical protein
MIEAALVATARSHELLGPMGSGEPRVGGARGPLAGLRHQGVGFGATRAIAGMRTMHRGALAAQERAEIPGCYQEGGLDTLGA